LAQEIHCELRAFVEGREGREETWDVGGETWV